MNTANAYIDNSNYVSGALCGASALVCLGTLATCFFKGQEREVKRVELEWKNAQRELILAKQILSLENLKTEPSRKALSDAISRGEVTERAKLQAEREATQKGREADSASKRVERLSYRVESMQRRLTYPIFKIDHTQRIKNLEDISATVLSVTAAANASRIAEIRLREANKKATLADGVDAKARQAIENAKSEADAAYKDSEIPAASHAVQVAKEALNVLRIAAEDAGVESAVKAKEVREFKEEKRLSAIKRDIIEEQAARKREIIELQAVRKRNEISRIRSEARKEIQKSSRCISILKAKPSSFINMIKIIFYEFANILSFGLIRCCIDTGRKNITEAEINAKLGQSHIV